MIYKTLYYYSFTTTEAIAITLPTDPLFTIREALITVEPLSTPTDDNIIARFRCDGTSASPTSGTPLGSYETRSLDSIEDIQRFSIKNTDVEVVVHVEFFGLTQ